MLFCSKRGEKGRKKKSINILLVIAIARGHRWMYVSKRRKDSLHTKYKRFPSQRYLLILADLIKPCTQNLTNKKEMNNIKKEFWIQPSTLLTFSPFLPRKKTADSNLFISLSGCQFAKVLFSGNCHLSLGKKISPLDLHFQESWWVISPTLERRK